MCPFFFFFKGSCENILIYVNVIFIQILYTNCCAQWCLIFLQMVFQVFLTNDQILCNELGPWWLLFSSLVCLQIFTAEALIGLFQVLPSETCSVG